MKITLLIDNLGGWIVPYAQNWAKELRGYGHKVAVVHKHSKIQKGDVLFLLNCEKRLLARSAALNRFNLVIHASDLPKGKGWSPMTWQILQGKTRIPLTVFKAAEKIDSGEIYKKEVMHFRGDELIDELREVLARHMRSLMFDFIKNNKKAKFHSQKGRSAYYLRRRPEDSCLDINKSIKAQFNLFRVADNVRYPVYFNYRGHEYILKIYKKKTA